MDDELIWRKALQSLTPGGSEFQHPKACVDFLRERLSSGYSAKKEVVKLKRQRSALIRVLEVARGRANSIAERWSRAGGSPLTNGQFNDLVDGAIDRCQKE